MDAELAFKIVVALMVLGGVLAGFGSLSVWAVFYFGSKGKLKVIVDSAEEKGEKDL
jgi:hypothetical protein